jgi:hypothetical protein
MKRLDNWRIGRGSWSYSATRIISSSDIVLFFLPACKSITSGFPSSFLRINTLNYKAPLLYAILTLICYSFNEKLNLINSLTDFFLG